MFLSRDAVSAFPCSGPLPQPLPDVRCPGWGAAERCSWRSCVNPSPRRIGRGDWPGRAPASDSQSLRRFLPLLNPCAYRAGRRREKKIRAPWCQAASSRHPGRRRSRPPTLSSAALRSRRCLRNFLALESPAPRTLSVSPAQSRVLVRRGQSRPAGPS